MDKSTKVTLVALIIGIIVGAIGTLILKRGMGFNITALILFIMFLAWQGMMWKKIKLKKWQDYTLSAIALALTGWLVYLVFLS